MEKGERSREKRDREIERQRTEKERERPREKRDREIERQRTEKERKIKRSKTAICNQE